MTKKYKLDIQQRADAGVVVEQIMDDPEAIAFELVWRRHEMEAASLQSHETMMRVSRLLEKWKINLKNRTVITLNAMDAGKNLQLRKCIDELESAICPKIAKHSHHNNE